MHDAFLAGVGLAQKWIDVNDELPICYESGKWDGLRSDCYLVKDKKGQYYIGRLYSGILDGYKFNDWGDNDGFDLENITHWKKIEIE